MASNLEVETQSKNRAEKAVAAADAMLKPLGFVRDIPANSTFNQWGPGIWRLKSPRAMARLRLQRKPWSDKSEDSFIYRLELIADDDYGVRKTRIAPGNAEAVKDYFARVEAARLGQVKRESADEKKAALVAETFANDYPNLHIVKVEADHRAGQTDVIVRTKAGVKLCVSIVEHRFLSLTVGDPYGESTTALDNLSAALMAL